MNNIQKKEKQMNINVTRSSMPSFDEYVCEIRELWDTRWLSNRGTLHKRFEKMLEDYLLCSNPALFANGHVALEVAINAFNFQCGAEIITTPYTHCSTTHSIVRNNLVPVFVDVRPDNFTINAELIEQAITSKTVAIVATHVYGYSCDVHRIDEIAQKHNLKVIYDAAHAFGVMYEKKGLVNYGDASMVSCHATKVFHTIEGGFTVFKDPNIREKVEHLINFGFYGPESVKSVSTNARMNEFEAAMGICNLRHFQDELNKRGTIAEVYREKLGKIEGIRLIQPQPGVSENYSYWPVFFEKFKKNRDQVQKVLFEKSIFARKYFYPLVTDLECYQGRFPESKISTPVALKAAETVLCLPIYADLSVEEAAAIANLILA